MRSYELSISENYVPTWGVVEAVREFFQNALDEETRDTDNKMFFFYDPNSETLRIGNKHGKLDPKTLLFGFTDKNDQEEMIGNHGEGYKIATVVLLRLNKQITFYNYGFRQVWIPRFVKSRKYGVKVPTFFVDTKYIWEKVPDNDLVIEIKGITSDEYEEIKKSNLHINGGNYSTISTDYGDILTDEDYKSKIFVGGLFICSDPRIDVGVDFKPSVVRLERDRSMVNSFDVQWYLARMIEQSKNKDLIKSSLSSYSGQYISYYYIKNIGDEIAKDFLDEYGLDAVPVSSQEDAILTSSKNTVIVSETQKKLILDSTYYKETSSAKKISADSVYRKACDFVNSIRALLPDGLMKNALNLVKDIKDLEEKLERFEIESDDLK